MSLIGSGNIWFEVYSVKANTSRQINIIAINIIKNLFLKDDLENIAFCSCSVEKARVGIFIHVNSFPDFKKNDDKFPFPLSLDHSPSYLFHCAPCQL